MPIPVSDEVLAKNIETTIKDVIVLLGDANKVQTRAKTVYYKCILLLAASILEALVYDFVKCHCAVNPALLTAEDNKKLSPIHPLSSNQLGVTGRTLVIAEEVPEPATLRTVTYNSRPMNKFCLNVGLNRS